MALKSAKEKLLSFAISFDSEIAGIGQTPPVVELAVPKGNLILKKVSSGITKTSALDEESALSQIKMMNSSLSDLKIEPDRAIPYATSHIFNYDMPAIKDMLRARKMEGQLDHLILKGMYEIAEGGNNAGKILEALTGVDKEVENVEELLAAVQSMVTSLSQIDETFEQETQKKVVTEAVSKSLESLGISTVNDEDLEENTSFFDMLSKNTSLPVGTLEEFTNTSVFLQSLSDIEWSLRRGISLNFLIGENQREVQGSHAFSVPSYAVESYMGESPKSLRQLGVGDTANYDSVFQKNAMKRVPTIDTFGALETVAYYCSVLSHEYLLSAGLGGLVGSSLGQRFGAEGDPLKKLFGTSKIKWQTWEDSEPDSLSDCAVVDTEGNIHRDKKNRRVQLFEGSDPNNEDYETAKSAWIDSVKSDPLNNKMGIFTKVLDEAIENFDAGEAFLRDMLGGDSELSLLTPAGLFARIIKDFAGLLEGLTVATDANLRNKNAVEIMFLVHCAKGSSNLTSDLNDLRRRMHIFACRLANLNRQTAINEDAGALVRITSSEASKSFQGGIAEIEGDKKDVAFALIPLAETSEQLGLGRKIKRTGQQIIDSVADNIDSKGLNAIIVGIFEDLQAEALKVARVSSNDATYIRKGGTTKFSGFDGAITLAFLYESFTILADAFCAVEFELDKGMEFASALYYAVKDMQDGDMDKEQVKAYTDTFLTTKHTIQFQGGSTDGSKLNKARKFLLELSSAIDNEDLSNLIDSSGTITGVVGLQETSNIGNGVNITPSGLIALSRKLLGMSKIPMENFAIAKSIVHSMKTSTSDLSQRARALKGEVVDVPDDIAVLKKLGSSQIGKDFINGLTPLQLRQATSRLEDFKNVKDLPYKMGAIPAEVYKCFNFLLDEKENEFVHSAILFIGLPSGLLSKEIMTKGTSEENASLNFSIDKVSELTSVFDYTPINKLFSLKYSITDELIIASFEEEIAPTNFNELVLLLTYNVLGEDEPVLGSEIISLSSNPTKTRQHLNSLVESYLFKKMFETLESLTLEEEKIQLKSGDTRSFQSKELMSALGESIGLSPNLPDLFFQPEEKGLKLPDENRLKSMIQPKKVIVQGIDAWKNPVTSPGQLDAVYDMFSTKPFFVERIQDIVLSRSIFDDVYAIMINLDEFNLDEESSRELWYQTRKTNNLTYTQFISAAIESRSPDRLSIESLYVSVDMEVE